MREPKPQSPNIPVHVPNPPDALARSAVHSMPPTLNPSNPTPEAISANHEVRLAVIEERQKEQGVKLDWIIKITVLTLLSATGELLLIVLKH
jgi:hypothetical protein